MPSHHTLYRNVVASRSQGSPGDAGTQTCRPDGAARTPPSSAGVHITGEGREQRLICSSGNMQCIYASPYETETKEISRTNNQLLREGPFKATSGEAKASSTGASKEKSPKKENNGRF